MAAQTTTIEYTSMKAPKDVVRMIGELAAMENVMMQEWCDTELRKFVTEKLRKRVARRAAELGGES